MVVHHEDSHPWVGPVGHRVVRVKAGWTTSHRDNLRAPRSSFSARLCERLASHLMPGLAELAHRSQEPLDSGLTRITHRAILPVQNISGNDCRFRRGASVDLTWAGAAAPPPFSLRRRT